MLTLIIISHIQKKNHFAFYLYTAAFQVESWSWDNTNSTESRSPVSGFPSNLSKGWSRDAGDPLWHPVALHLWLSPLSSEKFTRNLAQEGVSCCLSTAAEIQVSDCSVPTTGMLIKYSRGKTPNIPSFCLIPHIYRGIKQSRVLSPFSFFL